MQGDQEWLTDALSTLSPFERRCIELIYFARRTQQQGADALGVPPKAVAAATMRALRVVAKAVEPSFPDDSSGPGPFLLA